MTTRHASILLCFFLMSLSVLSQGTSVCAQSARPEGTLVASTALQQPAQPRLVAQLGHSKSATQRPRLVVQSVNEPEVNSVSIRFDGRAFAFGTGHAVKLWDVSGNVVGNLQAHTGAVWATAFSPDGTILASGSHDGTVRLWNAQTGHRLGTLSGHVGTVEAIAFCPDAQKIASGGGDGSVRIWGLRTGEQLSELADQGGAVWAIAFHPSGHTIASGGPKGLITVWDAESGRSLHTLDNHRAAVASIAFSPSGETLASGGSDGTVVLWEASTGRLRRKLVGHGAKIMSVSFSPGGELLATASVDGTIRLWRVASGEIEHTLLGHSRWVNSVVFDPRGRYLASGGGDRTVILWDAISGEQLAAPRSIGEDGWTVITPTGQFDASPSAEACMHWAVDLEPLELRQLRDRYYEPGLLPKLLGLNPQPIRDVSHLPEVELYPAAEFVGPELAGLTDRMRLMDRGGGIGRVAIRLNGIEVVADARGPDFDESASETEIKIDLTSFQSEIRDGQNIVEIGLCNSKGDLQGSGPRWQFDHGSQPYLVAQAGPPDAVTAVAFSPDGSTFAIGMGERDIQIWDPRTYKLVRTLRGQFSQGLTLSSNGKIVAAGQKDGPVGLWDAMTGEAIMKLEGLSWPASSVKLFRADKTLIAADEVGNVKVWDVKTGRELGDHWFPVFLHGEHLLREDTIALSDDGRYLARTHDRGSITVWNVNDNRLLHRLSAHEDTPGVVIFSSDGRQLASGGATTRQHIVIGGDKARETSPPAETFAVKLWDVSTGNLLHAMRGHSGGVRAAAFSRDGKLLATGGDDKTIILWDVEAGSLLATFSTGGSEVKSIAFSRDDKFLVSGEAIDPFGGRVTAWNIRTGETRRIAERYARDVNAVSFDPNGRHLAAGGEDGTIRLWCLEGSSRPLVIKSHTDRVFSIEFSADGRTLVSGSWDGAVKTWDSNTGKLINALEPVLGRINVVTYSPSGRLLAIGGKLGIDIRDLGSLQSVFRDNELGEVFGIAFNPKSETLAAGLSNGSIAVWERLDLKPVVMSAHRLAVYDLAFSPDGMILASGGFDQAIHLWEAATRKHLRAIESNGSYDNPTIGSSVHFSADGRTLVSGGHGGRVKLWNVASGALIANLPGHSSGIGHVRFGLEGRVVASASFDATVRLWDVGAPQKPREVCTLYSFADEGWAVLDPESRFDASNAGDIETLHWVVGNEPIALSQLKERYYEPNLLAKALGFSKEALRDVKAFKNVALYPSIELTKPEPGDATLGIKLTNRGGGIGKVVVLINGKEMAADARGERITPDAKSAELSIDIKGHPYFIPGKKNQIEVKAYNAEGYLSSRGVVVDYDAPGTAPSEIPALWAIVAGVSDYSGEAIDLRYAAKDARDIATALKLGGSRLFGSDKVKLLTLTTLPPDKLPTKDNLRQAFKELHAARPWDIMVVYLAGHGVAQGDEYYYLTQEARSADLTDPAVRERVAISSGEMVEWIKQSPSTLQVMLLDTCAAGTFEKKLSEKRDISSDQVRALDRMKDRTGFHVLMGSAADRVSYEATQYEQGLLTYALLEGMKGAALREQEFIDVSKLFSHAVDEVPKLAQNIGGIQSPRIAAPKGTSFDIGQLTAEDRQKIPLAQSKPFLLSPMFLNPGEGFDNLRLTALVRKKLRDDSYASGRGGARRLPVVYVDAEQFTGVLLPSGTYSVAGDKVQATLVLVRDQKRLTDLKVEGDAKDPSALAAQIVEGIMGAVENVK